MHELGDYGITYEYGGGGNLCKSHPQTPASARESVWWHWSDFLVVCTNIISFLLCMMVLTIFEVGIQQYNLSAKIFTSLITEDIWSLFGIKPPRNNGMAHMTADVSTTSDSTPGLLMDSGFRILDNRPHTLAMSFTTCKCILIVINIPSKSVRLYGGTIW